ncbi:hypothetical protein LZ30DRAFT_296345 [Colletotrichum cereale]|nr:hypothetical protein LZ30DRAFT_296345 [Colletotrichum cereale]
MSANIDLIQGSDGQMYYMASDGVLYPYSSLAYASPSYASNQQYPQDPGPSRRSTRHEEPQYDDEEAEAGSFQGDPHVNNENPRKASSSARGQSEKKVSEYVKNQKEERKHRDKPCSDSGSRRRKHKTSTKSHIEEILRPFKS